jgi:hypothetical protein
VKYYNTNNFSYSPLIKKARILNNSLITLNNILELDYIISFSTKEGDLLAIISKKDFIIKSNSSTLKDSIFTIGNDNSALKNNIYTTGNNDSTTKSYDFTIRGNSSSIENSISLKTNTEPLIALEPLISIRYFENYLL